MKSSRLLNAICMVAAVAFTWACQPEPQPEPEKDPDPEIKITGVTNSITLESEASPKTFNVKGNYAWTISSSQAWLAVSPTGGAADEVVTVTITPEVYEESASREADLTITVKEKNYEKTIKVTQLGYDGPAKDKHPAGTVFFEDDLNWITGIWPEKLSGTKGGWTSVKLDGVNYNEFSLKNGYDDVDAEFDKRGYTYNDNNSTYCRYDGSVKLGRAAQVGYLCTPALSDIDDASVATISVTWDASIYVATNNTPSANQYQKLQIVGEGEFKSAGTPASEISADAKTITVPVSATNKWQWVRKQVIVSGADKSTAIQFGVPEAVDARSFIDNIKIARVEDNATPAADEVQPAPEFSKEIGTPDQEEYIASGGAAEFTVTINREWKVSTTADWISFGSVEAGKSGDKNGNTVSSDKKSVDVCAAGFPYVVKMTIAENASTEAREAKITITSEGAEQGTVTIRQAGAKLADKSDSHAAGYEFLHEDFNWITGLYNTASYSFWGWPTVTTNRSGSNDQQVKTYPEIEAKLKELGWTWDATETYARYEGFIRMGRAAQRGSITTPVLTGIDADSKATVDVAFNTGMYTSAGFVADTINILTVSVIGPGNVVACGSPSATIASDGKSADITVENDAAHRFVWNRKHVIIAGVTNETAIKFGKSEKKSNTRHYLDDVFITRVADGTTTAAADAITLDPITSEFKLLSTETVAGEGGEVGMSLRANRAFTVTSDADWLTIKTIAGGSEKGGVTIAENKLSATVTATGIEYCSSVLTAAANTGSSAREGHVTVAVTDGPSSVLTVKQDPAKGAIIVYGEPREIAKWTFTSLFNTFTHSDGKEYVNECEAAAASITAWKAKKPVPSDVVAGATLSATHANSASAHTGGTNTQAMNRMRFSKPSVGDSFDFTFDNLTVAENSKIAFKYGYITGTNGDKSPGHWIEEYSLNGTDWVAVKELKVGKANPSTADDATFMDCEFVIPEGITNGKLYFRVRIASNATITNKTFDDTTNDIVYIGVYPAMATNSFAVRLKLYTDPEDYLTFTVQEPVK